MTLPKIPLVAVLGSPIAHSKSPMLHGAWLKQLGIKGHYIPIDVSIDDLPDVLKMLPKMGFVGANVTIPHKQAVMSLAESISDRAAIIGAANTLTFRDSGGFFADNTDGFGFIENIRQSEPDWQPNAGPALVLGAGGASRAILAALLDVGVPEIILSNRTRARADQLRDDFGARVTVVDWVKVPSYIEGAPTLVNTTSLGMEGKADLTLNLDGLRPETLVTDIVYTPLETTLLKTAKAAGCKTVDGLGMLIYQAVPGFERWFGQRPIVDDSIRHLLLS